MKRSEMQKAICELLEEQSKQATAFMFKAQQILELIEKQGMLPPKTNKLVAFAPIPGVSRTVETNEWGDEDENH